MDPTTAIIIFIVVALVLSCCCVIVVTMMMTNTENVGDLFKDDEADARVHGGGGNYGGNQNIREQRMAHLLS